MSLTAMGIDLGIHKIAWSVWNYDVVYGEELMEVKDLHIDGGYRPTELQLLASEITDVAFQKEVDTVWIEDNLMGNNVKYSIQLAQTMGAVLSHLSYVNKKTDAGIYTINVGTWKKKICGNGHASKDDIRYTLQQLNPEYAALCDGSQDRYDAALIGLYGLRISKSVHDDLDQLEVVRRSRKRA